MGEPKQQTELQRLQRSRLSIWEHLLHFLGTDVKHRGRANLPERSTASLAAEGRSIRRRGRWSSVSALNRRPNRNISAWRYQARVRQVLPQLVEISPHIVYKVHQSLLGL
ncbi:hypothetical protein Vafri_218 [Volvox africanus]|nr:hypothetical protein Vafri_218 [Volvox africanus]